MSDVDIILPFLFARSAQRSRQKAEDGQRQDGETPGCRKGKPYVLENILGVEEKKCSGSKSHKCLRCQLSKSDRDHRRSYYTHRTLGLTAAGT